MNKSSDLLTLPLRAVGKVISATHRPITAIKRRASLHVPPAIRRRIDDLRRQPTFDETEIVFQAIGQSAPTRVMIDVGAHSGASLEEFARNGWRIFAFEPDPANRANLAIRCKRFPRVQIDSRAVSNSDADHVKFYTSDVSSGISGLSWFHPSHQSSFTVDTVRLDTFCRAARVDTVDFLKIDTEGYDLFVLQSLPWDEVKPLAIVCEFEDRKTMPLGYTLDDIRSLLADQGYRWLVSEWYPIAAYGIRHRWRDLYSDDRPLSDEDAWGNLIAARDDTTFAAIQEAAKRYLRRFR